MISVLTMNHYYLSSCHSLQMSLLQHIQHPCTWPLMGSELRALHYNFLHYCTFYSSPNASCLFCTNIVCSADLETRFTTVSYSASSLITGIRNSMSQEGKSHNSRLKCCTSRILHPLIAVKVKIKISLHPHHSG